MLGAPRIGAVFPFVPMPMLSKVDVLMFFILFFFVLFFFSPSLLLPVPLSGSPTSDSLIIEGLVVYKESSSSWCAKPVIRSQLVSPLNFSFFSLSRFKVGLCEGLAEGDFDERKKKKKLGSLLLNSRKSDRGPHSPSFCSLVPIQRLSG